MTRTMKTLIIVLAFLAVGAGLALTEPQVPSDTTENEQVFADHALRMAGHTTHPLERLLALNSVVRDFKTLSPVGHCGDEPFIAEGVYEATVELITVYRIAIAQFTVGCMWASRG